MAQVTIYLDDANNQLLKQAAKEANMSVSRWLGNLIRERTAQTWPQSALDLAGAWRDEPAIERPVDLAADLPRESL